MYNKTTLAKKRVPFIRLLLDLKTPNADVMSISEYDVHESRATRLVGDSRRFMTVSFTRDSRDGHIKTWLEELTQQGKSITYQDDEYIFLGYTENNLKAGHLIFFREGDDFTVDELKENFGDLKAVYNASGYGKYAARLGLSFSSTIATEEIEPVERILLEDLAADDGSLTSDGCGLIRDSYSSELSALLGISFDTAVFQIRLGGIKGTLTRCPDDMFDELCGVLGKKIAYRRSMVKYNDGPHILEVQQVSKPPKSGRLNKQFIVLLLTLGIPISVFEELLQMQLDEIDKITTHREKALECVDGEVDAEGGGFYQELYEMLLAGHDMNEPYLAALLRRFQKTSRDALRKKLNIPVKGSGYLFGVVDHCGVLKEGEVYINLPAKGGPQVGPVAAMRNPAFDPNGVRVLEAVNKPELKHLTNCIVFAASGTHSEPDRMGGGDLDGDQYFVVFNPLLIPQPRAPPAAAAVKKPVTRSRTIAIGGRTQTIARPAARKATDMRTDAIQTFVSMRGNFLLGALSNEWMGLVGTTPDLADSPACKALVPIIEAALDIVKSGGSLPILKNDFDRLKTTRVTAQGTAGWKNPFDTLAELIPESPRADAVNLTCDPQLILRTSTSADEWDTLVREAEKIMPAYNRSLQLAIEADKEAKLQGLQEDDKRADLAKATIIAKHFPPIENILVDMPRNLLKASVWYVTGYKSGKQSFAWLGARWLNHIKAMQSGYVSIAVGARSTALAVAATPPSSTPPRNVPPQVKISTRVPPTPFSLARPSRAIQQAAAARPVPVVLPSADSDSESEMEDDESDVTSEEFEFVEKESAYDTALEDLVPAAARLRITMTNASSPVARQNTDDTLVNPEPESIPTSRPRARAPPSPISPSSDVTGRPRTRAQTRAIAPPEPARADANVTITRPRTRGQARAEVPRAPSPEPPRRRARTRAVSPMPAPTGRTRSGHTHAFLIRSNGLRPARVCACGALWTGSVNA
ncbi:RNA dependent RNA polymerase-domain-containing protein [Mycena vulgaris]|nr:RNA dependent RNA polymerase-domain-containing protein [Mycena vulgaris]